MLGRCVCAFAQFIGNSKQAKAPPCISQRKAPGTRGLTDLILGITTLNLQSNTLVSVICSDTENRGVQIFSSQHKLWITGPNSSCSWLTVTVCPASCGSSILVMSSWWRPECKFGIAASWTEKLSRSRYFHPVLSQAGEQEQQKLVTYFQFSFSWLLETYSVIAEDFCACHCLNVVVAVWFF